MLRKVLPCMFLVAVCSYVFTQQGTTNMKRKCIVILCVLFLGLCANITSINAQVAPAGSGGQVTGQTTCTMTSKKINGTGPWTIYCEGTVGIDSTVKSFTGVSFQVLQLLDGGGGATYNGVVNLPDGPPTAGGAAVKVTGTSPSIKTQGDYRAVFTMQYVDSTGTSQTKQATVDFTL
jgi:hypothetical protein